MYFGCCMSLLKVDHALMGFRALASSFIFFPISLIPLVYTLCFIA